MKGALARRGEFQYYVIKDLPSVATTDLKGNEKNGTYNEKDNDERATVFPEIYYLNNEPSPPLGDQYRLIVYLIP